MTHLDTDFIFETILKKLGFVEKGQHYFHRDKIEIAFIYEGRGLVVRRIDIYDNSNYFYFSNEAGSINSFEVIDYIKKNFGKIYFGKIYSEFEKFYDNEHL